MTDDALLKARTEGYRAKALLEDETLQAAFAEIKRTYAEKLLSTSVQQSAEREILYQAHRLVGEVENHLSMVLNNGKIAEAELNHLIRLNEPKQVWVNVR